MYQNNLILLLPLILLLHNYEEFIGFAQFKPIYFAKFRALVDKPDIFFYATVLLDGLVLLIALLAYFNTSWLWADLALISVIAISMNALQHILFSLFSKNYQPGVYSSVLLILPYSLVLIFRLQQSHFIEFTLKGFAVYLLLGFLFMMLSIVASLSLAYSLRRFYGNKVSRQ